MRESILATIERASVAASLNSACIILSARGVRFKVTVKEPNVIQYWATAHGIEGRLVF